MVEGKGKAVRSCEGGRDSNFEVHGEAGAAAEGGGAVRQVLHHDEATVFGEQVGGGGGFVLIEVEVVTGAAVGDAQVELRLFGGVGDLDVGEAVGAPLAAVGEGVDEGFAGADGDIGERGVGEGGQGEAQGAFDPGLVAVDLVDGIAGETAADKGDGWGDIELGVAGEVDAHGGEVVGGVDEVGGFGGVALQKAMSEGQGIDIVDLSEVGQAVGPDDHVAGGHRVVGGAGQVGEPAERTRALRRLQGVGEAVAVADDGEAGRS